MKTAPRRCKCHHCKGLFLPDYRNRERQRYCSKPECRRISKQRSQKAWLSKPKNQDYFHGAASVVRVQQWRKAHPGYWKRAAEKSSGTLQEACSEQATATQGVASNNSARTLQDLCSLQAPLVVGLISMLTGGTLQEDIVITTRQLVAKGHDILGMVPGMKLERFHEKTCPQSGVTPESSAAVQLDRSSAGAGKLLHPV